MVRYSKYIVAIGVLAVCAVGQIVAAQGAAQGQPAPTIKRATAMPIASVEGKDSYAAYCAVCHGRDATGNGPAAPALKASPSDLTRIASRNGGKFDVLKVEDLIVGKSKVPMSHGTPDMPIWGPVFHAMSLDAANETLRVQNLVNYLKSIQAK
jgi:mono/diheme cytochrome c family protein